MRRRSSVALPSFGTRRGSNASTASSIKDDIVKDIFHVGLVNLGNSCFYNTIVQSLSATQPLTDIISQAPESSPALRALSPTSSSYDPDLEALPSPLPMTAALLVLLNKLDPTTDADGSRGRKAFNPKGLLRQLSLKYDEYAEATQQDSHELLRHLIDGVMMEEQDLIKKIVEQEPEHRPGMPDRHATAMPGPNGATAIDGSDADAEDSGSESDTSSSSSSSSSDDELDGAVKALTSRERKKRQLRPFVGSIFEGKLASFIICDECKNVSLTKEDFMDISLPLKDETGNRMRKRDRIRRTLQAGFFSRKSGKASGSDVDSVSSAATPKAAPNGVRKERASLSENDRGRSSASEADETDEDLALPARTAAVTAAEGDAGVAPRSRHASLDPAQLTREAARATLRPDPRERSAASSRDPSPLGRALSVLSNESSQGGHPHHHYHGPHFHRRPKIPKPTPEQIRYIKQVLHDVPGPETLGGGAASPAPGGMPAGLRVARPPGSAAPDASASSPSADGAAAALSKLRLSGRGAADWQHTDLFECFRQFTSVEVLEGENSFACRNCWKWLNPDLEAKRREARACRRRERDARREARRAAREGREPRGVAAAADAEALAFDPGAHGSRDGDEGARLGEEESDDEIDPADRTARNTPAHSPRVVPAFAPLEEIPPLASLEAATGTAVGAGADEVDAPALAPMRSFSVSSAGTSNAPSTNYDGGISSDAFETTTDEEDNASLGLDDAASLSGSLGALPAAQVTVPTATDAATLPLTTANVEAVAAQDPSRLAVPHDAVRPSAGTSSAASGSRAPASPAASSAKSLASAPTKAATKPPPKKQRHILRRAHKRYLISSDDLPPVLVVHLKRFMQTSKSSLFGAAFVNLKKRDDFVSFPKEMDLSPFLAPAGKPPRVHPNAFGSAPAPAPAPQPHEVHKRASWRSGLRHAHAHGHGNGHGNGHGPHTGVDGRVPADEPAPAPPHAPGPGPATVEPEKEGAHSARYRLYAAVVHHGSLDTGHYASYVLSNRYGRGDGAGRGERRWVFCSDEDVTAVSEAEVLRSKAYMLFYERVPESVTAGGANSAPPVAASPAGHSGAHGSAATVAAAAAPLASLGEESAPAPAKM
ncbi:hypothetical protein JCM3770_006894 [Rhodotorula araucariae]